MNEKSIDASKLGTGAFDWSGGWRDFSIAVEATARRQNVADPAGW